MKKYFPSFVFFYSFLGYKIIVSMLLSLAIGVMDGFGLAMFIPLLQMVSQGENQVASQSGHFSFLFDGLAELGIPLSLSAILMTMVFFFIMKGVARFAASSYLIFVQQQFVRQLRMDLVNGLNEIEFRQFVVSDVGRIQNTLTGEIFRVSNAYRNHSKAIEQGILVMVYFSFALSVDPQFAILVSVGGVLTNFLYRAVYRRTKQQSAKLTQVTHRYEGLAIQYLGNFKYLQATNVIGQYFSHLKEVILNIEKKGKNIGVLNAILLAVREPMMIGIVAITILFQVYTLGGSLSAILVSLLFFYRALAALTTTQSSWNQFVSMSGSLYNVLDFRAELFEQRDDAGTVSFDRLQHRIEVKNISFGYQEGKAILRDISLVINKNEVVAFVGESGSGKSSLMNLVTGLVRPGKGEIYIDGQDSSTIKKEDFRRRIGYITQEPVIFNDTIFNNVTLWADDNEQNRRRFGEVCRTASINTFIENLEQKDETKLGFNGINISGGQKQRISIARELYKDIDLLIMDEATSALDTETEQIVKRNIEKLRGKYTLLIVAHRLSTVKTADKIVLMKGGSVLQIGNYEDLRTNPYFKSLNELQLMEP